MSMIGKAKGCFIAFVLGTLALLFSCSNNIENRYAHERAFLRFSPVTGVVPLNNAVNGLGEFCTIRIGTNQFIFRSAGGQEVTYPITAEIKAYGQPECVVGFVVGKSTIPDMKLQYPLLAYDLVCPNCYEQSLITKALTLETDEKLTCSRCHRSYNLKDDGNICQGDAGKPLYRYRTISYNPNINGGTLVIIN